ncbi:hypothetical protein IGI04_036080 [Brassica rapa subsp. trilocularis]|uniref:Uncharacterized protein n=1 Tax=Brassica rapa subsp. trilocularis TaxID=1813537 RepID=A0ABQ7LG90_BRACM|nr:hypothetical protein IGI04_036080 [Brassica rapa subsp. trilocularis]
MSSNELGSWPIYIMQQPIRFRLVAARVSLCMAPDACTATPRAPHVLQHGQDSCRVPPLLPDVRLHDWNSCKVPQHHTHGWPHASVACVETPRAWSIHVVLLHVKLHVQLPCTNVLAICIGTPRASWSVYAILTLPLRENISRASGFLEKFHNTEIRGFAQLRIFMSCFQQCHASDILWINLPDCLTMV